tara:strand:+ start:213 stop:995 length:783 start_codon:yes stop_codon:yes gene_type:complete
MLLFPCNRLNNEQVKLGFNITNPQPNVDCMLRMYNNDTIVDEFPLQNVNNFCETVITANKFKIKFDFIGYTDTTDTKTKMSISNITWGPAKGLRRFPICFFKDNEYGEVEKTIDRYSACPNETIVLNFENFIYPEDRKNRIHNIIINGDKTNIGIPFINLVHDYKKGIALCSAVRTTWNTLPFYYLKLKLKIVDDIQKMDHVKHFVKINKIDSIDDYFEFVRSGYNLSLMSYITIGMPDKYNKDKYTIPRWTDNENGRNF